MINKQAFFRIWLRNAIPLAVSLMRPLRLKVVFLVIFYLVFVRFNIVFLYRGTVHLNGGTLGKFRGTVFSNGGAIFSNGASIFLEFGSIFGCIRCMGCKHFFLVQS